MRASIQEFETVTVIHGCLHDDRAAIEAFFNAFNPRLVDLLRRRVGDRLVAEDLAQETLMRALAGLDHFDESRPMWPWLKAIALNLATDHARRTDREVPCEEIFSSEPDSSDRCEQAIMLDQAMSALSGRHRAALSLRYLNDWRPTEAAAFLGMSRPAFDQLLLRAKRKLGVEYRRMQSGLQALILLGHGRIRTILQDRAAPLWRRIHTSSVPPSAMASVSHVLTVAAVAITTIASQPAPIPSTPGGTGNFAAPATEGPSGKMASHTDRGPRGRNRQNSTANRSGVAGSNDGSTGRDANENGLPAKAKDFTDPHHGVKSPEDVQVMSLAFGKDDGSVVYATGKKHCRLPTCAPVLFRSGDGGGTWTRKAARGLSGSEIAVPPGRPNMVFAMGSGGLQVSRNGGNDFGPALATGAPMMNGAMAISPRWSEGDPTILVGAQTLFQYRDSTGTFDPYVASLNGPFQPAYPTLGAPNKFFLGALRPNGVSGPRATVYTCNTQGCTYTGLPVRDQLPEVRPSRSDANLVYAFTQEDLFVSRSRAVHFNRVSLPWSEPRLFDLETLPADGSMVAALTSIEDSPSDGVYLSTDGGSTWAQSNSSLFRSGATDLAVAGHRVMVALRKEGLACSNDGGLTFSRRCS